MGAQTTRERLLITGLHGRSGQWMLREMEDQADRVCSRFEIRALARPHSAIRRLETSEVPIKILTADLNNPETLTRAFADVDVVLHIAGIHWSTQVVDAALASGVRRLVLVHTTGIFSRYKAAGEGYRRIEEEIERKLRGTSTSLTILRPTMIYGTLDDANVSVFIRLVDALPLIPVVGGGRYGLQPVHHSDLGRAYLAVLLDPGTSGKNYVLSGRDPVLLIDLLATIANLLGRRRRFVEVPYRPTYGLAWVVNALSGGKVDIREKVQRLVESRVYSHDPAVDDFQYSPIPLIEGLRDEVAAYQSNQLTKRGTAKVLSLMRGDYGPVDKQCARPGPAGRPERQHHA